MKPDPNSPDVLLSVSTEAEAVAIVTALAAYDVEALSVGGFTAGFKAEAPGTVAIVVKLADFDRAKQALAEIRAENDKIDWSKVDVTETPDEHTVVPPENGATTTSTRSLRDVWWIIELIGLMTCFVIWSITRQLTPTLVYVLAGLAILGLFLALIPFARR